MGGNLSKEEIRQLAESKVMDFYKRRIESIKELDITDVLKRKNPYLYKALGFTTAEQVVREVLTAHSISSYEGIFGDAFFEPLAEEICGGTVSDADGVDIVNQVGSIYRAYAIKSGGNVFNASSKSNQKSAFQALRGRVQKRNIAFDAVVGYGYGNKISNGGKSNFREISGQALWKELSEIDDCYLEIAEFSANIINQKRDEFDREFEDIMNLAIIEFKRMFCSNGEIDWSKWIKYNSAIKCKTLDIKADKKTINASQEIELKINVILNDDEDNEFTIDTDDSELTINASSENIIIEDNKIKICNKIAEREKVKIIFTYRHKSKTLNINLKN